MLRRSTRPMLWLAALIVVISATAPPSAMGQDGDLLQTDRWRAGQYGLSLRPPKNTRAIEQAADQSIVKFAGPEATFSLYIRAGGQGALAFKPVQQQGQGGGNQSKSKWQQQTDEKQAEKKLTREFLRQRGKRQFSFFYAQSVQLKDPEPDFTVAGHKATKLYFLVPNEKQGDWVAGQAYVILSPSKVAVFQLECAAENWQHHKQRFEAWLASVRIPNPKKLSQQRGRLLKAAHQWRESLSPQQIKQAIDPAPQWFRIRRGEKDVGYMRVVRKLDRELGEQGVRLLVNKRITRDEAVFDTEGRYFATFDGKNEMWSVKTTRRMKEGQRSASSANGQSLPQPGRPPTQRTWTETGLHSDEVIRVNREMPAEGVENDQWPTPPKAYLSQVGARLLMASLPHQKQGTYLFYAYSSAAGKLSLRRVRVQPLKAGRFAVRVKPTPQRAERVAVYDENGRLIRKRMADGLIIEPASKQTLRQAWNLR